MRGDMPCRRSFVFWKRWCPSGVHSARMLNAAALPLLVMLCLPLLCGCSAASSADSRTIPLSPILTSLRPVTLDGIEGAWMDWRDAQALAAWIGQVETAQ